MFNLFAACLISFVGAISCKPTPIAKTNLLEMKMFEEQSGDIEDDFQRCTSSQYPNATFIDNKFYFDNCHNYAVNNTGICGFVAAQIILNYYDTFQNDNLISEEYDAVGISYATPTNLSSWVTSPGSGTNIVYPNQDSFIDVLQNVFDENFNPINFPTGLTAGNVKSILEDYTEDRNLECTVTEHLMFSNAFNNFVQARIDDNEPIICCVPSHFVVVYGYDDDYFYFDSGYRYSARAPKSLFSVAGMSLCVRYQFESEHVHSDNYLHNATNTYYCGCGESHHKLLKMQKDEWGFEQQYFFYNKSKQFTKDGLTFYTSRLRTGYIEETTVNLSPRRDGAGFAKFEIVLPYIIKGFSVEMAWWSDHELQNDGYARIVTREDNDWMLYFCDLHTQNLPLSKNALSKRMFIAEPDTDGIGFYLSNLPTGDRNLGRLSLGEIRIEYCLD
jgi:hypothetical protein